MASSETLSTARLTLTPLVIADAAEMVYVLSDPELYTFTGGEPRPSRSSTSYTDVRRPRVPGHCPSHVTLCVQPGIPSLRARPFLREFRRSLRQTCERGGFRVVHYSVQRDHVHLLVESAGKEALGRGMKAIGARTWLLVEGWRRHGLVDPAEVPGPALRLAGRRS